MNYSERAEEKVAKFCFANCFQLSTLVNVVLMYLVVGFVAESVRRVIFVIVLVLFWVLSLSFFVKTVRIDIVSMRVLALYIGFLSYYVYGFAYSLIAHGLSTVLKDYFFKTIIISGTCFLLGYVGAKKGYGKEFFRYLEKGSLIVFPLAVYYAFVHLFNCANSNWNNGADIGPLDYMTLAYLFMPYLLGHLLSFLFEGNRKMVLFGKPILHSQIVRGVVIFIYWIAILASGTRGAYLSVIISTVVMLIVKLFERKSRVEILLPIGMMGVMLFFGLFWTPTGMSRMGRWDIVLKGITEGQLRTGRYVYFENDEQLDSYMEVRKNAINSNDSKTEDSGYSSTEEGANKETIADEQEDGNEGKKIVSEAIKSGETVVFNRETLYRISLREFAHSPITGMGALEYSIRYGTYPHNICLESLSETGILGAIWFLRIIIYVLLRWIMVRKKQLYNIEILCMLVAYMVTMNITGTLWRTANALFFAIAYGTVFIDSKGAVKMQGNIMEQ